MGLLSHLLVRSSVASCMCSDRGLNSQLWWSRWRCHQLSHLDRALCVFLNCYFPQILFILFFISLWFKTFFSSFFNFSSTSCLVLTFKIMFYLYLTDLGRPRRSRTSSGRKTVPWETVAWETACRPYPGQRDARLRLGSGGGLSGVTGCSFNLSLTRCIKKNGQQKQQPALANQTLTPQPVTLCGGFVLNNPARRTTEPVPWLAPRPP